MKDFQKRNKMSMQLLLMEKERKYLKDLQKEAQDTLTSELYDDNNYFDIEREPEFNENVSTSAFLK